MTALLRNVAAVLTAAVLLLAGCSGGDGQPSPRGADASAADNDNTDNDNDNTDNSNLPDPCSLLPPATVVAIFESAKPDKGKFTVTAEREVPLEMMACNIKVKSQFFNELFTLYVFDGDKLEGTKAMSKSDWTPIPGVGDEAYLVRQGDCYVRVGKVAVQFLSVGDADINVALLRAISEHL